MGFPKTGWINDSLNSDDDQENDEDAELRKPADRADQSVLIISG